MHWQSSRHTARCSSEPVSGRREHCARPALLCRGRSVTRKGSCAVPQAEVRSSMSGWRETSGKAPPAGGHGQSLDAHWCEWSPMSLWPKQVAPPGQTRRPRQVPLHRCREWLVKVSLSLLTVISLPLAECSRLQLKKCFFSCSISQFSQLCCRHGNSHPTEGDGHFRVALGPLTGEAAAGVPRALKRPPGVTCSTHAPGDLLLLTFQRWKAQQRRGKVTISRTATHMEMEEELMGS